MNVKYKYVIISLNIILMHFGTNSDQINSKYIYNVRSGVRARRQAGYVYDKPTVSFDLPTATSIATTQAPTVDRIEMQMYYAYPVPAAGTGDTVNIGQQKTVSSAGSTTAVSSGANGYSYGVENTQSTDSRGPTLTEGQNAVNGGYQNTAVTGTQAVVSSGATGYGDGRPTSVSTSGSTGGFVSTSAPRYLPPKSSGENTVGVSVSTGTQAQTGVTITKPSDSYIPSSVQVSAPQQDQVVTVVNTSPPPSNPNTGYLLPNPQSAPRVAITSGPVQPVTNVPAQQYLPPVGQKTIEGSVAAPASTYLPPVF